jgi:hypothetical protein
MHLLYEDLARAHMRARQEEAEHERLIQQARWARRARRAREARMRARRALARALLQP